MNARVLIPLVVLGLGGLFIYDQYQKGQVALPGLPPPPPSPTRPTPPVQNPVANPTPTPPAAPQNLEIEPARFAARTEQRKIYELLKQKSYAEVITEADAWLRRNPTDALVGLARETAIVELSNSTSYLLGVSAPLTGPLRQVGEAFLQGVLLAVREVNNNGGFDRGGRSNRLTVRVLNDGGDRATAIKVAGEFARDNFVWGVIGPYSSSTLLAAAPIYNNSSNVIIAPAATNPRITNAGANIYRVAPSDTTQGAALARLVKARGHASVAVLFDENDAYSSGLAQSFKREANRISLVTSDTPITLNQYPSPRVGNYNVSAIFVAGYTPDVAAVARVEKPFGKPVFAGDGAYGQDLIAQGGDAVEGVIVTSFWHSTLTDANSKRFTTRFQNLFGGGTPNANALQAYDAARTLIEALRRAPQLKGGADVRKALETFQKTPGQGVTAPVRFDVNGDVVGRPWVAIQIQRASSGNALRFQAIGYAK
jgi:branched-chain amino acid transport system substrate-binding protein